MDNVLRNKLHLSKTQFPVCSHFGACAGCSEYLTLKPPSIWEEVISFFSPFSALHFHTGSPLHWRHRAKVAVRGTSNDPLIGLFKRSSHDVCSIPNCLVHHPNLNRAFEIVRKWIQNNGINPYDEKKGKGDLRYLQGVVERKTGRVQLSLVFNGALSNTGKKDLWRSLVEQLGENDPSLWHSLWINFNDQPINTIFGSDWLQVLGEEFLWETFEDVHVCYGPASFGQANLPLFEEMLIRIREILLPQSRVAEFYAGVGVIGLFIASRCEWVRCSELNPFAESYFQKSKALLAADISSQLSFLSSSARDALSILEDATTVIVDPPRKGLDPYFFKALKETSPLKQLLYISCGWDAFKKDYEKLCQEGWSVKSVDGYHFFPGSNHVELLVNFEKIDRSDTIK